MIKNEILSRTDNNEDNSVRQTVLFFLKRMTSKVTVDICISESLSPRKDMRQRTINNICLAFPGSDPKPGKYL